METLTIARRFCGPSDSANGGYACGVIGSLVGGAAETTLKLPPPLDQALDVERVGAGGARLLAGGKLVAEAKPAVFDLPAPPAPTFAQAEAASARFPWRTTHPYPTCFVCGPKRASGDGLCIYPGAVEGRPLAAAPFIPDASLADESGYVRPEVIWASLDCPSWFGFHCFHDFQEGLVLLGRLAVRIDKRPRASERSIAAGWFLGREDRKIHCASALYSEAGALLALGKATWIVLKS